MPEAMTMDSVAVVCPSCGDRTEFSREDAHLFFTGSRRCEKCKEWMEQARCYVAKPIVGVDGLRRVRVRTHSGDERVPVNIVRLTPTQLVTATGERFRRTTLEQIGGPKGYYSRRHLVRADALNAIATFEE